MLDANILIRAALGKRVRFLLEAHAGDFTFLIPEVALAEAEKHVATLMIKRRSEPSKALVALKSLAALGKIVGINVYGDFEVEAKRRLAARDPNDWPILASALASACPIWTEDQDFFGCGVATWTSANIAIFFGL